MSVRDGRRVRQGDDRPRPVDTESYADAGLEERDARRGVYLPDPTRVRRTSGGGTTVGLLRMIKFLVFTVGLASILLVTLLTVLRPVARVAVMGWAYDNASAQKIPFVADLVREDLGAALTTPSGADPTTIEFDIVSGDTPITLAARLKAAHLIADERAFIFLSIQRNLAGSLKDGTFLLRKTMTPDQVVTGLVDNRLVIKTINVTFREGLRLEQMTAKLQTIVSGVVSREFYDLVMSPPADLVAAYPWLQLPAGRSLEGFLYPATYTFITDGGTRRPITTARDLVKMMLDKFQAVVGGLVNIPAERKLTLYQIVVLASIVEQEAVLDEERPIIAGVYQNRLTPKVFPLGLLQSDPTKIYASDKLKLKSLAFDAWQTFKFWTLPPAGTFDSPPAEVAGWDTYVTKGLPIGPICSPQLVSILAALTPKTDTGYLFFIARGDGTGTTAFAKTYAEHLVNVKKYLK